MMSKIKNAHKDAVPGMVKKELRQQETYSWTHRVSVKVGKFPIKTFKSRTVKTIPLAGSDSNWNLLVHLKECLYGTMEKKIKLADISIQCRN